ncbi:hypothetical protein HCN58_35010 [Bradyrhizobium sp. WSM 1791]|uniref:Uncharacterized protein n=1 Tax=Bradyrhizobium australiense TaxID=2721161 RepID=A0A7Y4GZ20_9BRAD|nr:hypothetical protein [Bradyrhizobium australiense]
MGDCSYVLSLAKEMDTDCPVYAGPWPHFNEVCPPTLEAIASQVILAIIKIQPKGPISLRRIRQSLNNLTYALSASLERM